MKCKKKKLRRLVTLAVCILFTGTALLICEPEEVSGASGTVYSSWSAWKLPSGASNKRRVCTYYKWTTSENLTTFTISVDAYVKMEGGSATMGGSTVTLSATGQTSSSASQSFEYGGSTTQKIVSRKYTWNKGTAAQTVTVKSTYKIPSGRLFAGTYTATSNFTVPALAQVSLFYNGNGGEGAPGTQKEYMRTSPVRFTISSQKPYLDGYIFKGWATDATSSTPSFYPEGTIDISSNTTLYAVWGKATEFTGNIIWDDDDNADGIRPETVEVTLIDSEGNEVRTGTFLSDSGAFAFDNLENDTYTADVSIPGYTLSRRNDDIVLVHEPERMTVSGSITWNDDSNSYGKRPENCRICLYKHSTKYAKNKVGELTLPTDENIETFSFDVNRNENGVSVQYVAVPDKAIEGYDMGRDGNALVFSIKNAVKNMDHAFYGCTKLASAPSITHNVRNAESAFEGCALLTGTSVIDGNPELYEKCYKDTRLPIQIGGSCSERTCLNMLSTAADNNVTCAHESHRNIDYSGNRRVEGNLVPEGAMYFDAGENEILTEGDEMPELQEGDLFTAGGYVFSYGMKYSGEEAEITENTWTDTSLWSRAECKWSARIMNTGAQSAKPVPEEINGEKVTSLYRAFAGSEITCSPELPATVTDMSYAFANCRYLEGEVIIRSSELDRWEKCFDGTELEIYLSGRCSEEILQALSATSAVGNVH
ncbi:MAG: Cna B-type domain-containing protein [Firmicutes bacterium]|nr:Cna B-type domain-containing protein [Bacillota bacterium]